MPRLHMHKLNAISINNFQLLAVIKSWGKTARSYGCMQAHAECVPWFSRKYGKSAIEISVALLVCRIRLHLSYVMWTEKEFFNFKFDSK